MNINRLASSFAFLAFFRQLFVENIFLVSGASDIASTQFEFLRDLETKYSHEPVFLQAVEEMALAVEPLFSDPENGAFYKRAFVMMTEPERIISFRVPWTDDEGNIRYNRGWRVEFNR